MEAAVDRIIKAYGMIVNLTADEERAAREKVASHLAEKPDSDENSLAIEGLRYLRSVRELRVHLPNGTNQAALNLRYTIGR